MSNLILIKHSIPAIDPNQPANEWHLSDEGRARCIPLAKEIIPFQPEILVSSHEPKAFDTAQEISKIIHLPVKTAEHIHEHQRRSIQFTTQEQFTLNIKNLFSHPTELVFGEETAEQAQKRITLAINGLISVYTNKNIAIISHGTVISLFLSSVLKIDPFEIWKQLDLPSFVVVSQPKFKLISEAGASLFDSMIL